MRLRTNSKISYIMGFTLILFILVLLIACSSPEEVSKEKKADNTNDELRKIVDREDKIPSDISKVTPEIDNNPPKSYSSDYKDPIPLPYPINTAGVEDSAFITPDGETLYFFFTPDANIPPEKQLLDGVTGIYVSHKQRGVWGSPKRIILQDQRKLALDGCEFVLQNTMWFCSAREGYSGIHWFKTDFEGGEWTNWRNADGEMKTDAYGTGELHIFKNELYFHADNKKGGKGGRDLWLSKRINGEWKEPENLKINTEKDEGYPALSPDGSELWFTRDFGLWKSKRTNSGWGEPKLMFSPFAGEATIDEKGNVYFTHHFLKDENIVEGDIYVALKK